MELKARSISKRYGRSGRTFDAVKTLDLAVAGGEFVVVTGKSGSGKSTLLNMLSGLLRPDAGIVALGETELYSLSDNALSRFRNLNIGVIPQVQSAIMGLDVLENVTLPLRICGKKGGEEEARELLAELGIADLAASYPSSLSGGELRRMAIARALLQRPGIIFADEPTGDLDDENTLLAARVLKNAAARGAAVFLVTHERDLLDFADTHYVMDSGMLKKG